MSPFNPFYNFAYGQLFETILPDFVLAFAFFTSIIYLVVGKRFGQSRPAVAMSAILGFALAIGLVWWEQSAGLSIKNLGSIAAGFALIVLAGLLYQAIKQTNGSWAGAGIAIGACLLIGWVLGLHWPVDSAIIQTVIMVALTVGIIAFLSHRKGLSLPGMGRVPELAEVKHDMDDLYEDRRVSKSMADQFRKVKKEAQSLDEHPQEAGDVLLQLRRMLPAEGWLTERLAKLREKIWHLERGNIERIMDLQQAMGKLTPEARQKAIREIQERCKESQLSRRMERLDKAVAENEKRIRQITQEAQNSAATHDHPKLLELLKTAENLQKHNSQLFKLMNQTEAKLVALVRQIIKQPTPEVKPK